MSEKHLYKVIFVNHQQTYEIYVKNVYQGDMYGFVIVEGFVFGEKSSIVVDPSEEKLRTEFEGVSRSFIPLHEIIRIDQVKKRGASRVLDAKADSNQPGKISTLYTPKKK